MTWLSAITYKIYWNGESIRENFKYTLDMDSWLLNSLKERNKNIDVKDIESKRLRKRKLARAK